MQAVSSLLAGEGAGQLAQRGSQSARLRWRASPALLQELWRALQMPVEPGTSLRSQETLRRSLGRFFGSARVNLPVIAEEMLFHAMGGRVLSRAAQEQLLPILGLPALNRGALKSQFTEGGTQWQLVHIVSFCVKLEMLGFDIDSGAICSDIETELGSKTHFIRAALPEDRTGKRVTVYEPDAAPSVAVRTLRTHRGFIIQAHLDRALKPSRLDVFGPKYNAVAEWMAHVGSEDAWRIELRDAAGYKLQAASF